MVLQFIDGIDVESFYAPYYCEETDQPLNRLMVVGKDVPELPNYQDYEFDSLEIDGHIFEPDFPASEYLVFLGELISRRKAA